MSFLTERAVVKIFKDWINPCSPAKIEQAKRVIQVGPSPKEIDDARARQAQADALSSNFPLLNSTENMLLPSGNVYTAAWRQPESEFTDALRAKAQNTLDFCADKTQ